MPSSNVVTLIFSSVNYFCLKQNGSPIVCFFMQIYLFVSETKFIAKTTPSPHWIVLQLLTNCQLCQDLSLNFLFCCAVTCLGLTLLLLEQCPSIVNLNIFPWYISERTLASSALGVLLFPLILLGDFVDSVASSYTCIDWYIAEFSKSNDP